MASHRVALVTGVSRRAGIGLAIAERLLADGLSVMIHSWTPHDAAQPWGADPDGIGGITAALAGGARLAHVEADLGDPAAPRRLIDAVMTTFGAVDVVIANHAHNSTASLETTTAEELDRAWAVNARSVVLLAQAFAARHDDARPAGRFIAFTSGQDIAAMADELPYAISKGAVHQMTRSLADALADRRITVNAVNPGPVDTGWAVAPEQHEEIRRRFPAGRWGQPANIAPIVSWLASAESQWVTGQVLNTEGGFRR